MWWRASHFLVFDVGASSGFAFRSAWFLNPPRPRWSTPTARLRHRLPGRSHATCIQREWRSPTRAWLGLTTSFPHLAAAGSSLVGNMPVSHIFRPAVVTASTSLTELLATAPAHIDSLVKQKPPPADQIDAVLSKTCEEFESGHMSGPFTCSQVDAIWGRDQWLPAPHFALRKRSGKLRVIDNGRSGGHNDATADDERIHTCSNLASVAILHRFRELVDGALQGDHSVRQSSQDMVKTFRQVPLSEPALRYRYRGLLASAVPVLGIRSTPRDANLAACGRGWTSIVCPPISSRLPGDGPVIGFCDVSVLVPARTRRSPSLWRSRLSVAMWNSSV